MFKNDNKRKNWNIFLLDSLRTKILEFVKYILSISWSLLYICFLFLKETLSCFSTTPPISAIISPREVHEMETKDIILELRKKRGLSQDELATKVMVTRQAVSRWENGETIPNTETLKNYYLKNLMCRLTNFWGNQDSSFVSVPVFINYDKPANISDTTKYEDHFVKGFRDCLIAISKSGRSLKSEDVQNFLKAKERNIKV